MRWTLCVRQDPIIEAGKSHVNARIARESTGLPPGGHAIDDVVVGEWGTIVSPARVAAAVVQPASAHHVVGDSLSQIAVAVGTHKLVDTPDLNLIELAGIGSRDLKYNKIKPN